MRLARLHRTYNGDGWDGGAVTISGDTHHLLPPSTSTAMVTTPPHQQLEYHALQYM